MSPSLKTIPKIFKILHTLSPFIKPLGVTQMHIIGSYARHQQTPHSDLDILCLWKSKHHWAANSNALSEFLSSKLKIKIDLTALFHHRNQPYNINKIPRICIF